MMVTDHVRTTYLEQGFAVVGEILDLETQRQVRGALDAWFEDRLQGTSGPYGILRNNVRYEIGCVADLMHGGVLAAAACEFLGSSEVVLFQDNLVWKPPGAGRIEWHQDYSYWPLDAPRGITFWLSLDDAAPESGCLHYVPGTHRLGECQPADFIVGTGQPTRPELPPLNWSDREVDALPVPTRAGTLLVHHPLVWHMSPANRTTRHRRALTMSWIGPDVAWDPDHAPHPFIHALAPIPATPVRGEVFPVFRAAPVDV